MTRTEWSRQEKSDFGRDVVDRVEELRHILPPCTQRMITMHQDTNTRWWFRATLPKDVNVRQMDYTCDSQLAAGAGHNNRTPPTWQTRWQTRWQTT